MRVCERVLKTPSVEQYSDRANRGGECMCAVSLNKKALLCTAVALMMLMTVRCSTGAIGQPHLGRSSN